MVASLPPAAPRLLLQVRPLYAGEVLAPQLRAGQPITRRVPALLPVSRIK